MKRFRSPDGTEWTVTVQLPGASNAMVHFRHPDGRSSANDRYAWYISDGPEARSVTARLSPKRIAESLHDADLAKLFRRSMPVSRAPAAGPELVPASAGGARDPHDR